MATQGSGEYTYEPPIYQVLSQKDIAARAIPRTIPEAKPALEPASPSAPAASKPFKSSSEVFEELRSKR